MTDMRKILLRDWWKGLLVIQILKEEEEGAEVEAEEEGEEGEEAGEEDEAESRIYYTRLISSRNEISIYQRNEMKEKEHFQNAKNLLTRRKPNAPAKKDFKEDSGPQEENHFTLSKTGAICLLYTSPSPRDLSTYRMPSSA